MSLKSYSQVNSLKQPLEQQIKGLITYFTSALQKDINYVLLFGSCAKGTATYRSDIDILVILDTRKLTFKDVQTRRKQLEQENESLFFEPLPVQLSFIKLEALYSNNQITREALREGILIFGNEKAFKEALKESA